MIKLIYCKIIFYERNIMDKDIEKFSLAKTILGYYNLLENSKNSDGSINQKKLDELLKEKYNYIRRTICK